MAIDPTRYSRVSIGWRSSTQTLPALDPADTGPVFSVDGPFRLGYGGGNLVAISSITHNISFGSVPGFDSVSTTLTMNGVAVGDVIIFGYPSNYSGPYYDLDFKGHVRAANTVTVAVTNSAATAVNPDDMVFRVVAMRFDSFV